MYQQNCQAFRTHWRGLPVRVAKNPAAVCLIDFNRAYNPTCAYNPTWECPYPPASNRLKVAVRAGEKAPGGEAKAPGA